MRSLAQLIDTHGVQVATHLNRDDIVPVSDGLQRQGDIIVIPTVNRTATKPVPAAGVPVVRGENGGNTHLLLGEDGPVFYDTGVGGQEMGVVTVQAGSMGYLAHPEHGYAGIAPGSYVVRRQREQADEIRLVAD